MDDPDENPSETTEIKNVLPDVVHSQQIAVGTTDGENDKKQGTQLQSDNEDSQTESISEHIPSRLECLSESENSKAQEIVIVKPELVPLSAPSPIKPPDSSDSENQTKDPNKLSTSWPIDVNVDMHLISDESPVNLALSSDKERTQNVSIDSPQLQSEPYMDQSLQSENYNDSLNNQSNETLGTRESINSISENIDNSEKFSSGSEEIIKLDIRGQGVPKLQFPVQKIIFGPPPEGSTLMDAKVESITTYPNLMSPFLLCARDSIKVDDIFIDEPVKDSAPEKSLNLEKSSSNDNIEQKDFLVEEFLFDEVVKEKDNDGKEESMPQKSMPVDDGTSISTMTTEYKTICEEYNVKLVHLEDTIIHRDQLIEELTISLQRCVSECDSLRHENDHLINEVQNLQHFINEKSDRDTIKGQLSDFVKYQSMVKDDSTKFFSAVSSSSSMQSSNGEKDMDREEIVVNYSKSDLRSSEDSDDFLTGFEDKITEIVNKFDECIEENSKNQLRESLVRLLADEVGKLRIESDTEMKELEAQMQQDKQSYSIETRRLRELLASVKSGDADIDILREELAAKHEKEMENLRMYFEKKCSDMERSYSEEVWRGKCVSALGSLGSLDAPDAGDASRPDALRSDAPRPDARRRTRSADAPSLSLDSSPTEQAVRQVSKKYEQQLDELRAEHAACLHQHRDALASREAEISQLKAHLHSAENTETLYQQDIDLELEKVLLSDPDAEVSSWPLELVALRDRIQGDKQEKEVSSLRDELSAGDSDKWKQRRNFCFDQNRHLEEVTKERDELRRVAVSLHRAVGELVAYCGRAEHELNSTVLAELLARLATQSSSEDPGRPSSPNLSAELNASIVSRSGKHVHFAPDLNSILSDLDEVPTGDSHYHALLSRDFPEITRPAGTQRTDCLVGFLEQQRDLSADIKRELENSLRRLRNEAHSLLDLSARLARKSDCKMLESGEAQVAALVQDLDSKQESCDNCELHRKNMEEAMSECLQRENLLRSDLEAAMVKIAQLMASSDVVVEGYGTCVPPACAPRGPRPPAASPPPSPRADLELLQRERDDLAQQLEAANRQLRATRQFVEEQASEREGERDEFARREGELRDENARLGARLRNNARILSEMHSLRLSCCDCRQHYAHVEHLETQTREMNQIITELEARKSQADDEIKASEEKITLLRDIISTLETQLEQKTEHEKEILEELERMRKTIDERDGKMRELLGELESIKSEKNDAEVACVKCAQQEDKYAELMRTVDEQCGHAAAALAARTRRLQRAHCAAPAGSSEPSEDVSLREHLQIKSQESDPSPRSPPPPAGEGAAFRALRAQLRALGLAQDALLKRSQDLELQRERLADVAQEVRAERDVLQARMSEQALKISSLSARLQQQRNDAEALSHQATSQLSVQLHDALAEVQRLKEEMESKDKQLVRLRQNLEERDRLNEQHHSLYGNSCNPKDKVIILERELSDAQSRIAQLETLARDLQRDNEQLQAAARDQQQHLQQLLALKLDANNQEDENGPADVKTSARTLSDIVSISDFDEQDLQMRRAESKGHNLSLGEPPYGPLGPPGPPAHDRTLPPEGERPHMSSLHLECSEQLDLPAHTPRADSLPAHLTSTQNKDLLKQYKRNANEITLFGDFKHLTQKITDNCSMYPNRDVSDTKNLSVEPKKINFSIEPTADNRDEEEFTSLRELGIYLDTKQQCYPDILTQLKHEIKKSRSELEKCRSELKNAEEQLCEFPALKQEVEQLKGLLDNTVAAMDNDKKFYENQLESFSANKQLLEQRLTELSQDVHDKSKDLHLLKEDILRRENMILELAKEKRNLMNKMAELELKIDELQTKNTLLEKCEAENLEMREKMTELTKLEQLVNDKNQQIDSLNQHLDRLDDLQRRLRDKSQQHDSLQRALADKSDELARLAAALHALRRDAADADQLRLQLSKLEKDQENALLKLQNTQTELERVNSLNQEMSLKIQDMKSLTDQLKDNETEIEILNEDISAFHYEIASLKDQLKMASRSPSPRKAPDDRRDDRPARSDKRQLTKIRKQISLLQHELDFNKKELNDKAFELAKAKLDITELKNNLSQADKQVSDAAADRELSAQRHHQLRHDLLHALQEKQQLAEQLELVLSRLREESDVEELKAKLRQQVERCHELEAELQDVRELADRSTGPDEGSGGGSRDRARSPTAELERAVRLQLSYSHALDHTIMDQILSASSDEHEPVPRLALAASESSSARSSRSERERERERVAVLEERLRDKDALIAELNRVREQLERDWQTARLRYEAERENSGRLQLLLDTQKETALTLQKQDSNMIEILKKRLESAMHAEPPPRSPPQSESEDRWKGEVLLLKSKLQLERDKLSDQQAMWERDKLHKQRELDAKNEVCNTLRNELAHIKRRSHDSSLELLRARELAAAQARTIDALERRLDACERLRPVDDALSEIEIHKIELTREMSSLKKCLSDSIRPADTPAPHQLIRCLHSRCIRLESIRKALIWQKRYLQRTLHGYVQLERTLRLPSSGAARVSTGKERFKCAVWAVVGAVRLQYLVRRRNARVSAAAALLLDTPVQQRRPPSATPAAPALSEFNRRMQCPSSSPRSEPFVLSSPRGEMAAAYLNKLEAVSRCLNQTLRPADRT
ncbi:centrosome-associated protein CEP250 isoform X5 [Bombyx mori]|uniref:centrosome-associated protein CEP250 isoform X5 n=1 Tax=Bombyx mori TaxID=7091 RepID=UPI002ED2E66D